jgi:hypothetical protein
MPVLLEDVQEFSGGLLGDRFQAAWREIRLGDKLQPNHTGPDQHGAKYNPNIANWFNGHRKWGEFWQLCAPLLFMSAQGIDL